MPLTKKKPAFAPDAVVVAWQACSVDVKGTPYVVKRGERLRSDHPAVLALGRAAFAEDGSPDSERGSVYAGADRIIDAEVAAEAKHSLSAAAPRIAADTRVSDLVYCSRAVTWSRFGEFPQGAIVEKTHPIVAEAPDAFIELSARLA